MNAIDKSRHGVKIDGQFVFTCASCGGVAATLAVINDERAVDGGPMPGGARLSWKPGAPSYRLDFVGVNTGRAAAELAEIAIGAEVLDPLVVRGLDWELAAFCCRTCELNYCSRCWKTWVEFDDGFYDCTRGRCPNGHEQELDD